MIGCTQKQSQAENLTIEINEPEIIEVHKLHREPPTAILQLMNVEDVKLKFSKQ